MSHRVIAGEGPRRRHLGALGGAALLVLLSGTASDALAPEYRKRATASQPLVVCGMTGCFDVPPGCDGVVRRSGKGVVALVVCEKDGAPRWR